MAKPSIYIDETHPRKDGTCALSLRMYIQNKNVYIPLDISANVETFNKKTFQIAGKGTKEQNLLIKRAIGTASDILLKYQVQKKILTKDLFISEFSNPAVFTDFYEFMKDQILLRRGTIMDTTIDFQISILNKLKAYRKELLLTEIDETFLLNYQKHLTNKLKLKPPTVLNQMKTIKTYILKAVRMKLIEKNPFEYIKLKKPKPNPEFLTEAERDSLVELYHSNKMPETYRKVLRWFLFSCFTGLRISDLRSVEHDLIQNGSLNFHPIKTKNVTNNKVFIPLTKSAKDLITDESNRISGKLFQCYSEAKMNLYLKDIMKMVKINRNITFHTARHTFATIFLRKCKNANGILILKELLGHERLESTLVYSHVLDSDIKNAMNDFD